MVTLEHLGSKGKRIFPVVVVRKGLAKKSPGWLVGKMFCTNTPPGGGSYSARGISTVTRHCLYS